jgi:hypothetical protein
MYADALLVQDACNLSGVVYSFAEAMKVICEQAQRTGQGTDWKNLHPVAVLFASKIAHLTKCEDQLNFSSAYDFCQAVTKAANEDPYGACKEATTT